MFNPDEDIEIPKDQINSGGKVHPVSQHQILVDGEWRPWHQGSLPAWKKNDAYAEYAKMDDGDYSLVDRTAHRVSMRLDTEITNTRRYHDWKGYDDVKPTAVTRVWFNGIMVGEIFGYPASRIQHMLAVHRYIDRLLDLGVFGWWTQADLDKVIGKRVEYKGRIGTVERLIPEQGCAMVHFPDWPEDDYWDDKRVKVEWLSLNWWPPDGDE